MVFFPIFSSVLMIESNGAGAACTSALCSSSHWQQGSCSFSSRSFLCGIRKSSLRLCGFSPLSKGMRAERIAHSKLSVVVNECGQLFVYLCWACAELVICPGCNPTLALKIVGKVSRTPAMLRTGQTMWENRLWCWCELHRRAVRAIVL